MDAALHAGNEVIKMGRAATRALLAPFRPASITPAKPRRCSSDVVPWAASLFMSASPGALLLSPPGRRLP